LCDVCSSTSSKDDKEDAVAAAEAAEEQAKVRVDGPRMKTLCKQFVEVRKKTKLHGLLFTCGVSPRVRHNVRIMSF
jgi:hypothetical protein